MLCLEIAAYLLKEELRNTSQTVQTIICDWKGSNNCQVVALDSDAFSSSLIRGRRTSSEFAISKLLSNRSIYCTENVEGCSAKTAEKRKIFVALRSFPPMQKARPSRVVCRCHFLIIKTSRGEKERRLVVSRKSTRSFRKTNLGDSRPSNSSWRLKIGFNLRF